MCNHEGLIWVDAYSSSTATAASTPSPRPTTAPIAASALAGSSIRLCHRRSRWAVFFLLALSAVPSGRQAIAKESVDVVLAVPVVVLFQSLGCALIDLLDNTEVELIRQVAF